MSGSPISTPLVDSQSRESVSDQKNQPYPFGTPRPSGFCKASEVCKLLGLSKPTILSMIRAGEFGPHKTSPGGMMLVERRKVQEYILGWDPADYSDTNGSSRFKVALVSRVSDAKRSVGISKGSPDSDLARQEKRLRAWVSENLPQAEIVLFRSVRSGLTYDALTPLVSRILSGEFDKCICTTWDRLCRYGVELIREICNHSNCELIFTEANPERSEYESLSDEIIAILTSFSGRVHSRRAAKRRFRHLEKKTVLRAVELKKQGWEIKRIWQTLVGEGHTMIAQDDDQPSPISYTKVRKYFIKGTKEYSIGQAYLSPVNGNGSREGQKPKIDSPIDVDHSTFREFLQSHLEEKDGALLSFTDIYEAYSSFCSKRKIEGENRSICGRVIREMVPRDKIYKRVGITTLRGYILLRRGRKRKRDK